MTATAAMIARVRRMTAEPNADNGYTDAILQGFIEDYPLIDERGQAPYTWDVSTSPPSQEANADWIPTYDLHAAAADVWEEKAGTVSGDYSFSADGGRFDRSDHFAHCMEQARYHRARKSATTITAQKSPTEGTGASSETHWVLNMPEDHWDG